MNQALAVLKWSDPALAELDSISAIVVLRKGLSQAIEKLDQLLKASETLSGILAGKQLGSILDTRSRTAFDGNSRLSTCV